MTIMLNADEAYFMREDMPLEVNLCHLLQNMKLHYPEDGKAATIAPVVTTMEQPALGAAHDATIPDEVSYHSDAESCSSQSSGSEFTSCNALDEDYGCAYLQSIKSQLELFATTGGGYLEAIFTHREILAAYPAGHIQCSRALSDIAYALEQRAWRADREADTEAVAAFRHEAWFVATTMRESQLQKGKVNKSEKEPFMCIMRAW